MCPVQDSAIPAGQCHLQHIWPVITEYMLLYMDQLDRVLDSFEAAPSDRTVAANAGKFLLFLAIAYCKFGDYNTVPNRACCLEA